MNDEPIFLEDWIREVDLYFSGRDLELLRVFQKEWYVGSGDNPMLFPIKQTKTAWREHFEWFLTVSNFAIPAPQVTPFPKPEETYRISDDPGTIFIDQDQSLYAPETVIMDPGEPIPADRISSGPPVNAAPYESPRAGETGTIVLDRTDFEDSGDLDDLDSLILEAAKIKAKLKESEAGSSAVDTGAIVLKRKAPATPKSPIEPKTVVVKTRDSIPDLSPEQNYLDDLDDHTAETPIDPARDDPDPDLIGELDDLDSLIIEAEETKAANKKTPAKKQGTGTPPGQPAVERSKSKVEANRTPGASVRPAAKRVGKKAMSSDPVKKGVSGQPPQSEEQGTVLLDPVQGKPVPKPKSRPAAAGPGSTAKPVGASPKRPPRGATRPFPRKAETPVPLDPEMTVIDDQKTKHPQTTAAGKPAAVPVTGKDLKTRTTDNLELDLDDLQTMEWLED